MNEQQIAQLMGWWPEFGGVFSCDTLPRQIDSYPYALICNTDRASGPGEHWVAIYLDSFERGEYFDSYGLLPLQKEFLVFLKKVHWTHNSQRLQGLNSKVCGHYCVMYLWCKAHGHNMADIVQLFDKDLMENDDKVKDYIENCTLMTS